MSALNGVRTAIRLQMEIDANRLAVDLRRIELISAFAESKIYGYDDGSWAGIALVSADGTVGNLAYRAGEYLDTPALDAAPYVRELVEQIGGRRQRVRFLVLHPGGRIYAHRDGPISLERGSSVYMSQSPPARTSASL